jgi:carboxylesterase
MAPLADHLSAFGFTVSAPLLAGHGDSREQLKASTWHDWYTGCEQELEKLKVTHEHVCVCGLSLGGVLTLKLAQDHPQDITALCCLATPIFLDQTVRLIIPVLAYSPLRWLFPYKKKSGGDIKDESAKNKYDSIQYMPIAGIHNIMKLQKVVRTNFNREIPPTLLIHARDDSTAPYENMKYLAENLHAKTVETLTLKNSYHVITIDYDKDLLNSKVADFFLRHTK